MLDFPAISAAALLNIRSLLDSWLPGGKISGAEYTAKNPTRADNHAGSFKINIETGAYCDFATGDKGADLIDLYGYLHGVNNIDAAEAVAAITGTLPAYTPPPPQPNELSMQVIPVPVNAPALPTHKYIKRENAAALEFGKYPITDYWPYHTPNGNIIGYAIRFSIDGKKQTPFITLFRSESGTLKWRTKRPPKPLPLFNLHRLSNTTLIIVEGEKCASALQKIIPADKYSVTTWHGGVNNVDSCDWSPISGKNIILWPDFDLQERDGHVLPVDQQPGYKAMHRVGEILSVNNRCKFLHPLPGYPAGWDVADAIESGWDWFAVFNFMKENCREFKPCTKLAQNSVIDKIDNRTKLAQNSAPSAPDRPPFRSMGHNHDYHYFISDASGQLKAIKTASLNRAEIRSLAPEIYWERSNFQGEHGINWNALADSIIQNSYKKGIFDASKIRGRGAWFDAGRVVLHLGDHLIVDNAPTPIQSFKSKFIYESMPALEFTDAEPRSKAEAHKLRNITESLFWERPINALYLAGWCVIAPICGALQTRPHIWLTGGPGTGKTFVLENIINRILEEFSLHIASGTTEAAIRQSLISDALPVLFDEFDADSFKDKDRIQKILELLRKAFSESQSKIIKGSQNGHPSEFDPRFCALMSSVNVNINVQADASRISVISLIHPYDRPEISRQEHFRALEASILQTITPQWAASFRARSYRMIPVIRENIKLFSSAISEHLGSQRAGDQAAPLLAGAYSLSSDTIITTDAAREFIQLQDWRETSQIINERDELRCLNTIMSAIIRTDYGEKSVAELILDVKKWAELIPTTDPMETTNEDKYRDALHRNGIKYEYKNDIIYIAASHPNIRKILKDTSWERGAHRLLKRISGTIEGTQRINKIPLWSIGVPYNSVFTDEILPENDL